MFTRWKFRIETIRPLRYIEEFYDALIEIADDESVDRMPRPEADILAVKPRDFKCICCLIIWHNF